MELRMSAWIVCRWLVLYFTIFSTMHLAGKILWEGENCEKVLFWVKLQTFFH